MKQRKITAVFRSRAQQKLRFSIKYTKTAAHKATAQLVDHIPGDEKESELVLVVKRLIRGIADTVRGTPEAAARLTGSW